MRLSSRFVDGSIVLCSVLSAGVPLLPPWKRMYDDFGQALPSQTEALTDGVLTPFLLIPAALVLVPRLEAWPRVSRVVLACLAWAVSFFVGGMLNTDPSMIAGVTIGTCLLGAIGVVPAESLPRVVRWLAGLALTAEIALATTSLRLPFLDLHSPPGSWFHV